MLKGKKILLGVGGSIAAYKSASLIRLLVKEGCEVRVVATSGALQFITPLTLATLSGNPVLSEFEKNESGEWNNHVELGLWADLMLIAPASANVLGKMAAGLCDNLLLATYLSARCPVWVAPAMDLDMFAHSSTSRNLKTLNQDGVHIIDPESGFLASGLEGKGRMAEPEHIVEAVKSHFEKSLLLAGSKVLVTAGPTYENIDPVRFIGNYASGKMGFEIANAFARSGAEVYLIAGPVAIPEMHPNVHTTRVDSALEMYEACIHRFPECTIAVKAAAVADYRPEHVASEKIKKSAEDMVIRLVKNPDILFRLGQMKTKNQLLIGFALETENELENAHSKLVRKNADAIVLNSLRDEGAGFGTSTNLVTWVTAHDSEQWPLASKQQVAEKIVEKVASHLTSLA